MTADSATAFERMGGEPGVRALVDRFYDLMDLEPVLHDLRTLHPTALDGSRDKLFWFLCGWLGGPSHFEDRFGHPRLRARHLPYAIDSRGRDLWLACMHQALTDVQVPDDVVQGLWPSIAQLADHMRNVPDQPSSNTTTAPAPP